MKRILFRADAKPSIGTGDLISLIHLSRYFEEAGWETHFIIRDYSAAVSISRRHSLERLAVIDSGFTILQEVDVINKYVEECKIDVLFLEITERPLSDYAGLSDRALKACVSFDGVITEDISLVVNWDVEAEGLFDISKYPATRFLLGPEYVIVPPRFNQERIRKRVYRRKTEKLLIAMGGADELNFTQKIANVFIRNGASCKLTVIVGAGYQHKEELERSLSSSSLDYELKQNVADMFEEYMACDMAVGTGGLTAYELVATRTPAVLIATYEHQVARCLYFHEKGLVKYLGFRKFDPDTLLRSVYEHFDAPEERHLKTRLIVEMTDGLLKRCKAGR